jgi:glycopeptide antibiotics resistance protein
MGFWLVVDLPLKNMSSSVVHLIPYGKIIKMFQSTKQIFMRRSWENHGIMEKTSNSGCDGF